MCYEFGTILRVLPDMSFLIMICELGGCSLVIVDMRNTKKYIQINVKKTS